MNKKLLKVSLLALGAVFMPAINGASVIDDTGDNGKYNGDVSGHTFLSVRPQFQSGMPEKESLWRRRATPGPCGLGRDCGWGGAVQVVGFGGQSNKSARLGEFFMYGGSNQLFVSSNQELFPQIDPANFGLFAVTPDTQYSSTIQFNPRESDGGVGFEWRQYLGCVSECAGNWWFDISFPVVQISNRVTLTELNRTVSGAGDFEAGSATSMIQAFQGTVPFDFLNPEGSHSVGPMLYGLIPSPTGYLRKSGVADLELKIGYDALCTECCFINGYVGVLVPTGNRPKAKYIFEPIVGHNHHVGFLFGSAMFYDCWSDCDRNLTWEVAFDSRYLFSGHETRSFDLKYRPWSRYLLVYASAADAVAGIVSPGINYFTQEFKVTPRFYTTIDTSLVYTSMCGLQAQVGWNFWARESEKLKLKNPFPNGIAVAALNSGNEQLPNATNLLSNIGNNNGCATPGVICTGQVSLPTVYGISTTLNSSNIDFASATNPAVISNIIYGTVGYDFDICCYPTFAAVGGSYEFPAVNTALTRWKVWGKVGISF